MSEKNLSCKQNDHFAGMCQNIFFMSHKISAAPPAEGHTKKRHNPAQAYMGTEVSFKILVHIILMLIRKSTEVSIFCLCLGGIPFDRNFQVCFFCVRFQDKAVVIAKRKKSLKFLKL